MAKRLLLSCCILVGAILFPASAQAQAPSQAEFPPLPPAKKIRLNEAELAYVEMGQGEPVIFIHGFLHDYRTWSLQVPEFAKKFRAISYSLRYRWPNADPGESGDFSPEASRADLVALIRELELRPVHLVGHSSGANIALRVALEHPELVRSVVLGEPGPFAFTSAQPGAAQLFPPELVKNVREAYDRGEAEAAIQLLAEGVLGPDGPGSPLPSWERRILSDNAWQLRLLWTRSERGQPLTCSDVGQMKTPVLLLGGDRSPAVFGHVLDALEKCLPVVERAVLAGSSHGLELEAPAAFNEIVLKFIARRSAGRP